MHSKIAYAVSVLILGLLGGCSGGKPAPPPARDVQSVPNSSDDIQVQTGPPTTSFDAEPKKPEASIDEGNRGGAKAGIDEGNRGGAKSIPPKSP